MAQTDNNKVIEKVLRKFQEDLSERIVSVLRDVASEVISFIEGANEIPVQYGNLQDSTGLAIYSDGRMIDFAPNHIAIAPSEWNGYDIWGQDYLRQAIGAASDEFSDGIWLVLLSSTPYALKVDERTNFFSVNVVGDLTKQFFAGLSRINNG